MKNLETWCETPKTKTHSECDIHEELWGNWPMEENADIAFGYKERNFWNCSVKVLRSVKGPDETIVAVLDYGGL
jgi:hypothetical protein